MDASRGDANENGANNGAATRKQSSRARKVVDYDEKRRFAELVGEVEVPKQEEQEPVANSGLSELEERVNDLNDSWETDSLFEDVFEELTDDSSIPEGPEYCTLHEAMEYRKLLRVLGPEVFLERTVKAGVCPAKKLITAFGLRQPSFLEGAPDEAYYPLLALAFSRELSKRAKLLNYNTVDDAVNLLHTRKNIIVLTGAGISTSLGIPDFRSKGTGLYSKLEHLGLSDPQEVFDIRVFRQDPSIFYSVARDILPSTDRFTPTHAFIALLQNKGKLLTNYTQNIDNLEAKAGIKPEKLVQCHGSFATASCVKCGFQVPGEIIFPELKAGTIPRCRRCAQGNRTTSNSRKRKVHRDGTDKKPRRRPGDYDSNSDSEFDSSSLAPAAAANTSTGSPSSASSPSLWSSAPVTGGCGVMKPDIIFFGEPLPDEFSRRLTEHDRDRADLVIVIGTSLKVAPVSEVVGFLPPHIPQIYINRTPVSHTNFDINLLGDCDVVVAELCRRARWPLDHEMIPPGQVVEAVPHPDGAEGKHVFVQVAPPPPPAPAAAADAGVKKEEEGGEDEKIKKEEERDEKREREVKREEEEEERARRREERQRRKEEEEEKRRRRRRSSSS
ncbi:hypothetical protein VTK26DRAFT_9359 [Humicola hyalothermophila]